MSKHDQLSYVVFALGHKSMPSSVTFSYDDAGRPVNVMVTTLIGDDTVEQTYQNPNVLYRPCQTHARELLAQVRQKAAKGNHAKARRADVRPALGVAKP